MFRSNYAPAAQPQYQPQYPSDTEGDLGLATVHEELVSAYRPWLQKTGWSCEPQRFTGLGRRTSVGSISVGTDAVLKPSFKTKKFRTKLENLVILFISSVFNLSNSPHLCQDSRILASFDELAALKVFIVAVGC